MALSRIKTWALNETLTSADLNAEFSNILNNAQSLVSPWTGDMAAGGNRLTGLSAGSVSSPSLQFTSDANTGVYSSAADTVDIAAGGIRVGSFPTVASAVNYWIHTPSATTDPVTLAPGGTDTNIGAVLGSKGTGGIFLSTNSTNRWTVAGSSGHLLCVADDTYDIGAAGATRPRNAYLSGSAFISTILNLNSTLQTGATAGDAVSFNTGAYRFINAAGTSSANYGLVSDANDNLNLAVPAATDSTNFTFGGTLRGWIQSQNSGMGIVFDGESSADHSAPSANGAVIYTKDNGGKTTIYARFNSGSAVAIAAEP